MSAHVVNKPLSGWWWRNVRKAALATPLYLSSAWTLLVSYQLFTQNAVNSIIQNISLFWPSFGSWLSPRLDVIVFVHAFAWIFVLASMVPSVILGKGRSVLMQFIVCLTLTFTAVWFADIFSLIVGRGFSEQIYELAFWFENPLLSILYLSAPYLLMLYVDIRERRKKDNELTTCKPKPTFFLVLIWSICFSKLVHKRKYWEPCAWKPFALDEKSYLNFFESIM